MALNGATISAATQSGNGSRENLLDAALDAALRRGELRLAAQPIRQLDEGRGEGRWVELLVRPELDGVGFSPEWFVNRAVQRGLARELDTIILRRGLDWLRRERDVSLCSINVSGDSLSEPRFLKDVVRLLESVDVDPARLCIEVTESVPIHNFQSARVFARELRRAGCRMALDDFGGGASNMLMLVPLEMDYIKIDGRFIHPMPDVEDCRRVVRGVVAFARETGLQTVAECLESAEHAKLAREMNVDFGQGYYNHGAPRIIDTQYSRVGDLEYREFGAAVPGMVR